jgi:hypothetical protein
MLRWRDLKQQGLLVVGFDFEKIEGLFLAEGRSGLVRVLPIRDGQGGGGCFGAKDLPMIIIIVLR